MPHITIHRDGCPIELTVAGAVECVTPGRYDDEPGACYPADGGEIDVHAAIDEGGAEWLPRLTPKELERAKNALAAEAEQAAEDAQADDIPFEQEAWQRW